MNNYPDGVNHNDPHFNPELINDNEYDAACEESLRELRDKTLDKFAEAIMHSDSPECKQLLNLINGVLAEATKESRDPSTLCAVDTKMAKAASYIGYFFLRTGFNYWLPEGCKQTDEDMSKLFGELNNE